MQKYTLAMALCAAALLSCAPSQSPFTNTADAKIQNDKSLHSLDAVSDSVKAYSSQPCTVAVYLSNLIDSFYVVMSSGGKDSIVSRGAVTGAAFVFPLDVSGPGTYGLKVVVVKTDNSRDSISRTLTVYSSTISILFPAKDSLLFGRQYACSCEVSNAELADTVVARLAFGSADTVVFRGASSPAVGFRFAAPATGPFSLRIATRWHGAPRDSATKAFAGYPVIAAQSSAVHVLVPPDSFTFTFTATDLDSNLWGGYTWLGASVNGSQQTIFPPKSLNRTLLTRAIRVLGDTLLRSYPDTIVCSAVVLHPDSQVSAVAVCSLFVNDTSKPGIALISPTDTVNQIPSPVTVRALVTDIAGIDSVKFDTMPMVYARDTALFVFSPADSGKHVDSIVALDNAGNRTRFLLTTYIRAKKVLPPLLRDMSRATPQGVAFAPVWLDTCVVLPDTSIKDKVAYKKDSLTWVVTDSAGGSIAVPGNHLFTIPFPADTMWQGTFQLTFRVFVTNAPSLYDTKQPSFFVTPYNYPPVITLASDRCFSAFRADTIYLDAITTAHDPNDPLSSLSWTFTPGHHFKVDSLYSSLIHLPKKSGSASLPVVNPIRPLLFFTRHIVIDTVAAADASFVGTDTLTFTVTDPGGLSTTKKIYFTRPIGPCLIFHL
jgi:hypothetical protein